MIARLATVVLALAVTPFARADETALVSPPALRIIASRGASGLAAELLATAGADRASVIAEVGRDWDGVTEVRVAPDEAGFRELLPPGAHVPGWAQGVAFPSLNVVVLRGSPGDPQLRATLRHELSHIAIGQLARHPVPRWFLEGLATIHAGDAWSRKGPSLVRAALREGLFSFAALSESFPDGPGDAELAYAQSADFVQFLVERAGPDQVHRLLRDVVAGATFDEAVIAALGASPRSLENEWRRSLARWELLARLFTSTELWWGLVTLLFIFAWWTVRGRHRRGLEQLGLQDQAETADAFAESTRLWAERPADEGPVTAAGDPPQPAADPAAAFFVDDGGSPGKKPTLH